MAAGGNTTQTIEVFEHSGLAALSDLSNDSYRQLFERCEQAQQEFLAKETEFRSSDYRWPSDALHWWSRVWEYPFTYYQIDRWLQNRQSRSLARIGDFGSGVTFFPFMLAKPGCRVTCIDVDPIVEHDIARAADALDLRTLVDAVRSDGERLPFEDHALDAIYSISVLEHIPEVDGVIEEIVRVLRPGGLFVLTFDVVMRGIGEVGIEGHMKLTDRISRHFEPMLPEKTIHPLDVMTSENSPYPYRPFTGAKLIRHLVTQYAIKPLLGRPSHAVPALAVQAFVGRRR